MRSCQAGRGCRFTLCEFNGADYGSEGWEFESLRAPAGHNRASRATGHHWRTESAFVEVAQKNKEVRELMYPVSEHPKHNEVWDMVLLLYWRSHWFAETFNAARIALATGTILSCMRCALRRKINIGRKSVFRRYCPISRPSCTPQ